MSHSTYIIHNTSTFILSITALAPYWIVWYPVQKEPLGLKVRSSCVEMLTSAIMYVYIYIYIYIYMPCVWKQLGVMGDHARSVSLTLGACGCEGLQ